MQVDFPALDRPTNAISGTSSAGKKWSWGAVVKNLAVCIHPMAMVDSDFSTAVGAGPGRRAAGGFLLVVINIDGGPVAPL